MRIGPIIMAACVDLVLILSKLPLRTEQRANEGSEIVVERASGCAWPSPRTVPKNYDSSSF